MFINRRKLVNYKNIVETCMKILCSYPSSPNFVLWFPNEKLNKITPKIVSILKDPRLHKFGFSMFFNNGKKVFQVYPYQNVPLYNWKSKVELQVWANMPWQQILENRFFVTLKVGKVDNFGKIIKVWEGEPYKINDCWFMMYLKIILCNSETINVTLCNISNELPAAHFHGLNSLNNHLFLDMDRDRDTEKEFDVSSYITRSIPEVIRPYPCPLICWGKKENFTHVLFYRVNADKSHSFLMQHKALKPWAMSEQLTKEQLIKFRQDVLCFPGGGALRGEVQPEITAWRECKEECFGSLNVSLQEFLNAIKQRIVDKSQVLYIVNISKFLGIPPGWCGPLSPQTKEVSTSKFPTGYLWVTESEVDLALKSKKLNQSNFPQIQDIPVCLRTLKSLETCRDAFRGLQTVTLFHGTSRKAAKSIIDYGFIFPEDSSGCQNKSWKCSEGICCCAGMMGKGVYLAYLPKAQSNAGRVGHLENEVVVGVVIKCLVKLGNCKIAANMYKCACGCGTPQVDHLGKWKQQGFDSVKIPEKTISKRAEWCVSNAAAVKPVAYQHVKWSRNRELLYESEFIMVNTPDILLNE
jgi:hypothetical protein